MARTQSADESDACVRSGISATSVAQQWHDNFFTIGRKGSTTADDSGLLVAPWREHIPQTNLMLACVLGLVQQVWPSNGMTTSSRSGRGDPSQPTRVPQQSGREACVGQQSGRGIADGE